MKEFDAAIESAVSEILPSLKRLVAVLDFPILNAPPDPSLTVEITETVIMRLGRTPGVSALERNQIAQVIGEQVYDQGIAGITAAAAIGRRLHADDVVLGTITPAGGGLIRVRMRVVDVFSTKVVGTAQTGAITVPDFHSVCKPG